MVLRRFSHFIPKAMTISQVSCPTYINLARVQFALLDPSQRINHIQCDTAGTIADRFCLAAFRAFALAFKKFGITLTSEQITGPMGNNKIVHIRVLLEEIKEKWFGLYGRYPNEKDVAAVYKEFNALLDGSILEFTALTPFAPEIFTFLHEENIFFSVNSGYKRKTLDLALTEVMPFKPHAITAADEVPTGTRMEMVLENNRKLNIPLSKMPQTMVVTDAKADVENIKEHPNRPFIIGVAGSSTHMEISSVEQLKEMKPHELAERAEHAKNILEKSDADCVLNHLGELPLAMMAASHRLAENRGPGKLRIEYPKEDAIQKKPSIRL